MIMIIDLNKKYKFDLGFFWTVDLAEGIIDNTCLAFP